MALQILTIARATPPNMGALVTALTPLLSVGGAGSFQIRYQDGAVIIEQAHFTSVNVASVQAAVAAAPVNTLELDRQAEIDNLSITTKAIVLALIDQLNVIRAALPSPLGAITPAQAIAAVRAKAGTL